MADLIKQIVREQATTRAQNQGALSMAAREISVGGQEIIQGTGDALAQILFPVVYLEKPFFTCGFELTGPGASLVVGDYPYANALVSEWHRSASHHFIGFNLVVVVHGPMQTQVILNWLVTGLGISNPVNPERTMIT